MFVRRNNGWLSIAHIPLLGAHHEEFLHLKDTRDNGRKATKVLRALEAALREGQLEEEFEKRFPDLRSLWRVSKRNSRRKN